MTEVAIQAAASPAPPILQAYAQAVDQFNDAIDQVQRPGSDSAGAYLYTWARLRWVNALARRDASVSAAVRKDLEDADQRLADPKIRGSWSEALRVMAVEGQRAWWEANPPRTEGEATLRELRAIKALLAAPVVKMGDEPLTASRVVEPELPRRLVASVFQEGRVTLLSGRRYAVHMMISGKPAALIHDLRSGDLCVQRVQP